MKKSDSDHARKLARKRPLTASEPWDDKEIHHYLPIPDGTFDCGFYVTSSGQSTIPPGGSYPPSQHPALYHFDWRDGRVLPEFSLMLITSGEGVFESEFTGTIPLRAGSVVMLFPGMWHRYRPNPLVGWSECWMHFNGELAHRLLAQKVICPERAIVDSPRSPEVELAFRSLLARIHSAPTSNTLLLSLQGLGVLALATINHHTLDHLEKVNVDETIEDRLVSEALEFIWTRSHHVISVPDVTQALGVTRRTLERHMLAAWGRGIHDEIVQCRFSRAERLLRETSLPIKTVITLAGFGSLQNLRQVFVNRTGCAPGVYRLRHRSDKVPQKRTPQVTQNRCY